MNATAPQTVLIGTFDDRARAERFLDDLHRAGFRHEEVGIIGPGGATSAEQVEDTAVAGALTGGTVGVLAGLALAAGLVPGIGPVLVGGLLASTVAGAAVGATTGGLLGGLVALGLSEEEARSYEGQLRAGRTLVVVQAAGRYPEALEILRRGRDEKPTPVHEALEVEELDELRGNGP